MSNNPVEKYSEWTLRDAVCRLEGLKCYSSYELREDIDAAIECMEYVIDLIEEKDKQSVEDLQKAYQYVMGGMTDGC